MKYAIFSDVHSNLEAYEAFLEDSKKEGIENLSGRIVRDALASLNGFDGGLLPPVTMSDSHPYYTSGLRIYTYEAGKLMLHSDKWYEWAPVFSFETGTYPD